jgi:hypothetical protein
MRFRLLRPTALGIYEAQPLNIPRADRLMAPLRSLVARRGFACCVVRAAFSLEPDIRKILIGSL